MKKNIFQTRNLLTIATLALAIVLGTIASPATAYASSYNDYWNDADEDYDDYWGDADDDDENGYWNTSDNRAKKYLKLKSNKNSTYFKGIKGTRYARYIDWCGRQKIFTGILKKGKKIDPNTRVPKWVVRKMLKNGYGSRIDLNIGKSKASVKEKYFCNLTTKMAKQMHYNLSWDGESPNGYMSLGNICYCYYQMAKVSQGSLYTNTY